MRPPRFSVRSLAFCLALVLAPAALSAQRLYDPNQDAAKAIDGALAAARADGKLVFVDFGADWCLDCVVLDRLFQDSAVAPVLRAHYHVVKVDVGRFDRNLDISRRYGSPHQGGVPAAAILSSDGKLLVSTRNGALESARNMDAAELRRLLESWAQRR